jgi:hypothetical protein
MLNFIIGSLPCLFAFSLVRHRIEADLLDNREQAVRAGWGKVFGETYLLHET